MDAPTEGPMDASMEFQMEASMESQMDDSMEFQMDAQTAVSIHDLMNAPIHDFLESFRSSVHGGKPSNPDPQTIGFKTRREAREPHDYDDEAFDKEARFLMKKHNPEVMAASKRLDGALQISNHSPLHMPRSDPSVTPEAIQRNKAIIEAAMIACGDFGLPALKRMPGSQGSQLLKYGTHIQHDRTRLEHQPGSLTERLHEAVHLRAKPVLRLDLCDAWGFKEVHLHSFVVDVDGVEAIVHGQASFSGAATSAENENTFHQNDTWTFFGIKHHRFEMQESGRIGPGWCCFGAPKRAVDLVPCRNKYGQMDIGRDFPAQLGGGYGRDRILYDKRTANLFQCAVRLSKGGVAPMDFDEKDHFWKHLGGRMEFAMRKHSLKVVTVSEKKDPQLVAAHVGFNPAPAYYVGSIPPPIYQFGTSPQRQLADRPDIKRKASTAPTMLPPPPPKCRKSEAAEKLVDRTLPLNGLPNRSFENRQIHQERPDQAHSSSSASQFL